jgi:hypothetical protein
VTSDGERHPKKVKGIWRRQKKEAFKIVNELSVDFPVKHLCEYLGVTGGGYYKWRTRKESARSAQNHRIIIEIERIHREVKGIYGSPRMTVELITVVISVARILWPN